MVKVITMVRYENGNYSMKILKNKHPTWGIWFVMSIRLTTPLITK